MTGRMFGNMARLVAAMLLTIFAGSLEAASTFLPTEVQRVADRFQIPLQDIGVIVQAVGTHEPLVSINPHEPRNPASTMKVVTTLASLETLGPAYTWPTEVYATGPVSQGRLNGDLLIKGYGDPYFVTEEFWKMLGAVRRAGVSDINGDLVIDDSYFQVPDENPGAFDNRPYHAYNVLPNAFLVNFKATVFHFYPNESGSLSIKTEPETPNLKVENRIQAVGGRCSGYQHGIAMSVPDPARQDTVVFEGKYPRACGYFTLLRSLLTPETFAWGVFRALWDQLGGKISGGLRTGLAPAGGKPLLVWQSRPLGEIIRLVNKNSNNVMSRQLLLTLGADAGGAPGTVSSGIAAVNQYLLGQHIDPASLHIVNGAGLSREGRISPRLMADILIHAWSSPYMPEFVSSLSIVGMDGTAKNRMRHRHAAGHAHIKTGTLDNVSAVAGYVDGASGTTYVIVGMANHTNVQYGTGNELWNALIQWAYQH